MKSHLRTHENQRRNGKLRKRTIQTFLNSNQSKLNSNKNQQQVNQKAIQSPLIETTTTINSEQNSLLLCNLASDDKKSSANIDNKLMLNDKTCLSPIPNQTASSKQSNGVSNYNIETLLAETAKLKRNSDQLDYLKLDQQLNGSQLNQQAFLNNDIFKQIDQDKNSKMYRDYLYNFYYSYYYMNSLNAFNGQLKNIN